METLADRITRHEGEQLKLYVDTRGFRSIGIGRNLDAKGISHDEAQMMLKNDIASARADLAEYFPWALKLDTIRQEVLVEMIFQLGVNGVAAFKNTLQRLQEGDYEGAAEGMMASAWHMQTPARCEELAGLMRTGSLPETA